MTPNMASGEFQIIAGSAPSSIAQGGQKQVEGLFRFGCSYARLAKDGRHAWVLDLYQRKAIITGKALACEIGHFPQVDSVVRVRGQIIESEGETFLWVRELSSDIGISTDVFALDLATPNWVIDQAMVDTLSNIWSSLSPSYRELINAVLADVGVMRGFLHAPGSVATMTPHRVAVSLTLSVPPKWQLPLQI